MQAQAFTHSFSYLPYMEIDHAAIISLTHGIIYIYVSPKLNGLTCIFTCIFTCIYLDPPVEFTCTFTWIFFTWTHLNFYLYLPVLTCTYLYLPGFTWIYLYLTWILSHLDPNLPVFTCTHLYPPVFTCIYLYLPVSHLDIFLL